MSGALARLMALGALAIGGTGGRPFDGPDPRPVQTDESAQRELDAARDKRARKAARRLGSAR